MFRLQQLLELGLYDVNFKYAEEEALRNLFLKIQFVQIFNEFRFYTNQRKRVVT